MKISVIVPYRNEKRHIGRFLDSLLTQDLDPGWDLEIDDSFPGSTDAPFRLLSRAVAAAAPGDTVIVRDGAHGHENAESGGTAAIVRDRSSVSSCSIDHNLVFGAFGTIGDSRGCAVGPNFSGDPQFVNPSNPPYDFHLQEDSPAIGAGAFVPGATADADGTVRSPDSAPDIGAYAFWPF